MPISEIKTLVGLTTYGSSCCDLIGFGSLFRLHFDQLRHMWAIFVIVLCVKRPKFSYCWTCTYTYILFRHDLTESFLILISTWADLFFSSKVHLTCVYLIIFSAVTHSWGLLFYSLSIIHALHSMLIPAYTYLFMVISLCEYTWLTCLFVPYLFVILICTLLIWHQYRMKTFPIRSTPICYVFYMCVYI